MNLGPAYDPTTTPAVVHLVTRGEYDEYKVLAAFADLDDAQRYADGYNLSHIVSINSAGDMARVEPLHLYGPNAYRPTPPVVDGDVVDTTTAAIEGRSA